MREKFYRMDIMTKNRDANRGVVKESLVKSVDPENYLMALIHQLLGTGNDIR